MGIFKLNGIDYMGGGGGNSGMELTYDEYLALSEEEKNNGTTYYVKDINGIGKDQFQPIIYSEEEREIGVWTDGKPLYEKTYHFNITSSGQSITVAQNLNYIDTLVSMKGIMGNATMLPQGSRGSCSEQIWGTLNSNYNLTVFVGSGGDVKTGASHITIQYTKTTDQPGSGTWTPSGVPAVHYSENEQVVGTWIDGNTIYEKTLSFTTGIANTYFQISHNIQNAKDVWIESGYVKGLTEILTLAPYRSGNDNDVFIGLINRTNESFDYKVGSEGTNCPAYVTLRYTKQTS